MEKPKVISGPYRGLIKEIAKRTGKKYVTVRWNLMESSRMTEEKRLFIDLKRKIDEENTEFQEAIKAS
jgi:hypothetical protein